MNTQHLNHVPADLLHSACAANQRRKNLYVKITLACRMMEDVGSQVNQNDCGKIGVTN